MTMVRKQLRELIVEKPLDEPGIPVARFFAAKLSDHRTETGQGTSDELINVILSELRVRDVPTDVNTRPSNDPKTPDPPSKVDFAFVNSDQKGRLAIATLRNQRHPMTYSANVYFLDLTQPNLGEPSEFGHFDDVYGHELVVAWRLFSSRSDGIHRSGLLFG